MMIRFFLILFTVVTVVKKSIKHNSKMQIKYFITY